jgi:hypothetical protein
VRSDRTHRERYDVQGAAAHAAVKEALERRAHFGRLDPVVGRSSLLFGLAANEGPILHARDVARMRAREVAVRTQLLVQLDEGTGAHQLRAQAVVLSLRAIAPDDALGLGEPRDLGNPLAQAAVAYPRRSI